jgi:uncharacterized iron-regulated membrane protein
MTSVIIDDSPAEVNEPPVPGRAAVPSESEPRARIKRRLGNLFPAFWRWHFYASLLVIPALFVLSLSGLLMLYKAQIDPLFHPGIIVVDVPANGVRLPLSQQEAAVEAAYPKRTVVSVTDAKGGTATIFATTVGEGLRNVYVNPYTAKVTGDLAPLDLPSNIASSWHTNFTQSAWGGYAMELAACWAIVMAITGYYLFFKGRKARVKLAAKRVKGALTRNTHAWVGVFVGLGILALVVSGLPWTQVWGSTVQSWAGGHGLSLWGQDPGAKSDLGSRLKQVDGTVNQPGWAISQGSLPESVQTATTAAGKISIDTAVAAAAAKGIPQPYFIAFPDGKDGVFSVLGDQWHDSSNPAYNDVSLEATAHVDQYTGKVIATYDYTDYSPVAKVVSQGIAVHEGRRFGAFSEVVSTLFCLGVLFLCISAPFMWWRRRQGQKGIAAPKGKMPVFTSWGIGLVLLALAIILPVFGISLAIILLIDALVIRRVPALKRALNSR